jgi:hypothetical protein
MNRLIAGLTLAVLAGAPLFRSADGAAPPAKKPVAPSDQTAGLRVLDRTARYLEQVVELRKRRAAAEKAGQTERRRSLDQMLAAEEATVGRHRDAMPLMDSVFPTFPADRSATTELDGYEPKDATEAILALAERRQVVMINEAHHIARHRAFATSLLAGLARKGFRYFAAETFNHDDMPALMKRGYPTLRTGYYCREPVFGDLVRTAMRLGYIPVAYEHRFTKPLAQPASAEDIRRQIAEREEGQAGNLKERIFDKDRKARVVVFAGYSHVRKVPQVAERRGKKVKTTWMAARFKERTGIDPLTIDQTTVMEHSRAACEHPAYRLAVQKKKVSDKPVVLFNARTEAYYVPVADRGAFDVVVFHPREAERDARPLWLRMGGYRKTVKVAGLPVAPKDGSLLVQAFAKGEDAAVAIPVDQVEYGPGKPSPPLLLPKGAYRVRVVDAEGKTVHEGQAKVE